MWWATGTQRARHKSSDLLDDVFTVYFGIHGEWSEKGVGNRVHDFPGIIQTRKKAGFCRPAVDRSAHTTSVDTNELTIMA